MLLAPALVVSSVLFVTTDPRSPTELPLEFPVTAPHLEPEVIGFGHGGGLRANEPTILFVNFDGAQLNSGCGNNPKNNCSSMSWTFGGEIYPYEGGPGQRASLVQGVREDVKDFGIKVTDTRPGETEDYAMVLVGRSANGGSAELGFAGVAPSIDCGNSNPNITSFDLVGSVTVINQEAAHTWGLEHVNEKSDNLYPTSGGVSNPVYNDQCMKIVSDTMLTPSNGQCNSVHTQFCNSSYQNSYQEMLYLFGPGAADTVPPTATIDYPTEGETVAFPVSFELTVTLADNQSPQLMQTAIFLDDQEVIAGEFVTDTLKFPVDGGIAQGMHTWRVETADEDGNPAMAEVTFNVGMGGATTGATTDSGSTTTDSGGTTSDSGGTATDSGTSTDPTSDPGGTTDGSSSGGTDTDGDSAGVVDDDAGCSCSTDLGAPTLGTLSLLGLGLVRRRRRG